MKNILLFVNGTLGLKAIKFLTLQPDIRITGVVVNSSEKRSSDYTSDLLELSPKLRLFEYSENLWNQSEFQTVLSESNLATSALFGHIIPSEVIAVLKSNIVNLHPSLLPLGRGADPIAWAIIENRRQGVSIHVMEDKLDSGPIISQSELTVTLGMTAGEIYELAMDELLKLFKAFILCWPTKVQSNPQQGEYSYHQSAELQALRKELTQGSVEVEHALRLIQALTFTDKRTARVRFSNGELWEVSLLMNKVQD